jgi:XTP/dITP diphosphohydrolase
LLITVVTTSARVAPGVLTASAWDLLRSVPVFCGSPSHPQRAALAEMGVPVEVVDVEVGLDGGVVGGAGGVGGVDGGGQPATVGVPAVSEGFVAAMRTRAEDAGVTEVAWLLEPTHALPGGAGPDAGRAEPVADSPGLPPDGNSGVARRRTEAASPPDPPPGRRPGVPGAAGAKAVPLVEPAYVLPFTTGDAGHSGQGSRPGPTAGEAGLASMDMMDIDVEVRVIAGTRELPGSALLDAVAVMDRLRSPGGCPWDAEQTHASLAPYLLEEAYEAYQAIEDGNLAELREELGDVLLQVLFHARVAAEAVGGGMEMEEEASREPGVGGGGGRAEGAGGKPGVGGGRAEGAGREPGGGGAGGGSGWDVDAVAAGLVAKLVRRHPHVFGDVTVDGVGAVVANWEVIKDAEKSRASVTDGIPVSLPALSLARKLLARSARIGIPFDQVTADDAGTAGETGARDAGDAHGPPSGPAAGESRDTGDAGGADGAGDIRSDLPGTISALARSITHSAKAAGKQADGADADGGRAEDGGEPVPGFDGQPVPDLDGEVGRLLFAAVALADAAGIDPEAALRRTARTFRDRIIAMEQRASGDM